MIPSVSSSTFRNHYLELLGAFSAFLKLLRAGPTFTNLPRFSDLFHPLDFFLDLQCTFSQATSAFSDTFPRLPGVPFARLARSAICGRTVLAKSYHS
jgi:hypothetical protein